MSEVKRSEFGNTATEQGAYVNGKDFSGINVGSLPESRPESIEVEAEYLAGDGITLTPHDGGKEWMNGFQRALGELKEGPMDLLNAQLCEETDETGLTVRKIHGLEVEGSASRLDVVSRRSPREELVWYGMHPEYYGAVAGDRIMLRRDVLESAYSCKSCKGKGYNESVKCGNCGGECHERVTNQAGESSQVPCRVCRVMGFGKESWFSCGHKRCERCNGSGWKAGIVIQEDAQKQPITGVVVSVGPDCRVWKIGDRLLFSSFAGHCLKVSETEEFIMMRESEALGMLRQRTEVQR